MEREGKNKQKRKGFSINDHRDILVEVLKRLDGQSLSVAACVCRLWWASARSESVWEQVCFQHVSPPGSQQIVQALGGYKRLYKVCVRPVLGQFDRFKLTRQGAQLLLSLFCVDYYEKLGGGAIGCEAATSSLMFLCKRVNV